MRSLKTGDPAPDFDLPTHDGRRVVLSEMVRDHRGVIVYFYPRAATPGCTTQACEFRDNEAALAAAGYGLVGVSPDALEDLVAFAAENHVAFPFASDDGHAVADLYDVWGPHDHPKGPRVGVVRSTFVVGPDMRLTYVEHDVDPNGHVTRLREQLAA